MGGLVPDISTHAVGQHRAAAGNAALHCANRNVEHMCDLGVVEVADISQHYRHPEILGEGRERLIECQSITEPIYTYTCIGIHDVIVAAVGALGEAGERPPSSPSQFVEAGVGGDAIGPGGEAAATVELTESAHDGYQRLLRGIGAVGIVSCDAPTDRENAVVVSAQQLVKARTVAALRRSYE